MVILNCYHITFIVTNYNLFVTILQSILDKFMVFIAVINDIMVTFSGEINNPSVYLKAILCLIDCFECIETIVII